jgi:hypothetical protein|tara:strand:- start:8373 stop:8987 length:615 start_codon:yes stop_codon:yes gene_type:complete
MKISYAITVCNEILEIQKLLSFLNTHKREQDEVVVLYDETNGDPIIKSNLLKNPTIQFHSGKFDGHFANWKNQLTDYCSGDYIFQIDADEYPNKELIETLPFLLKMNKDVDVMLVPRINTVKGLTQDHIAKWRWSVNEKEWVNWPDYQWRIYKNDPTIKWINKVHERLDGFKQYATLPMEEGFALNHPKNIKRQEKQNEYYNTL